MGTQGQPDDDLVDLLVKQVTEGLSPDEQRALDELHGAAAAGYLRDFERAAAAITVAATPVVEAPPLELQARLERAALDYFAAGADVSLGSGTGNGNAIGTVERSTADLGAAPAAGSRPADQLLKFEPAKPLAFANRAAPRSAVAGWLAAAACLVLAVVGWLRSPPTPVAPVVQVREAPPAVAAAVTPPTPEEERKALLASADSIKVTLGATKDPAAAGVTGDVVWDPATQKGFLHFVGLAVNDPRVRQYQIWIFDGKRDKRYPVDGGVFDVPANSPEVVIPIHAGLPISVAKAFAVTVESPGGVVVSALGHVVALGATG